MQFSLWQFLVSITFAVVVTAVVVMIPRLAIELALFMPALLATAVALFRTTY